ncbi:hypothetical protein QOT17_005605 [Balamuthia mandrillaris]
MQRTRVVLGALALLVLCSVTATVAQGFSAWAYVFKNDDLGGGARRSLDVGEFQREAGIKHDFMKVIRQQKQQMNELRTFEAQHRNDDNLGQQLRNLAPRVDLLDPEPGTSQVIGSGIGGSLPLAGFSFDLDFSRLYTFARAGVSHKTVGPLVMYRRPDEVSPLWFEAAANTVVGDSLEPPTFELVLFVQSYAQQTARLPVTVVRMRNAVVKHYTADYRVVADAQSPTPRYIEAITFDGPLYEFGFLDTIEGSCTTTACPPNARTAFNCPFFDDYPSLSYVDLQVPECGPSPP